MASVDPVAPGDRTTAHAANDAPRADPSPPAAPRLTPPAPIDQPPLHPLMKTVVSSGPLGVSGLEEWSVRGRLRARLLVRADGAVGRVDILISSGDPALDDLAREGLRRWRFAPATRDGTPIEAFLLLWITFRD